ncbi:hypothetical protein BKA56DRAFT_624285 [Ilyonectria sp. MPI-CAGE-AT-0026]|nr:hypothetical protein BKA56DRAFT_624285 [Ilyonectria sp. MPI-CAGE-AT-0026]
MLNLDDVGVSETFEHLGLAENVPACYDYDTQSDNLEWRQGYKDGEYLVAKREFPMYFDEQDFPAKSAVGWVVAEDLRERFASEAGGKRYFTPQKLAEIEDN